MEEEEEVYKCVIVHHGEGWRSLREELMFVRVYRLRVLVFTIDKATLEEVVKG